MPEASPILLRRPRALAFLVLLISLSLSALVIWKLEENQRLASRADIANIVQNHSFLIRDSLDQALALNYSLAAIIRLNQGDTHYFEDFAREILPYYSSVSHLTLSPQGVITKVYPLLGNEASIGFNQLEDLVQNREALRARDSGKLTLAGPIELVQGGLGVVGRLPVFLEDQGGRHFWGFTNVTIRINRLLETANLPQLTSQGIAYKLWRIHPDTNVEEVIASMDANDLHDPVQRNLPVPNGIWTLSASPINGWIAPWRLASETLMALCFSLLLGYLAYLLVQLQRRKLSLQTAVSEQTRELVNARAQLQATLDAIPDLLFEVGSDGIIYQFHTRRPELLLVPPEAFIGKAFSEFMPDEVNQVIWSAMEEADATGFSEGKYYALEMPGGRRDFELSVASKAGKEKGIQRYVMLSRDITERKENEARINNLAFFDPLTQLPNRRLLQDRLEHAIATGQRQAALGALLYIDLDDFKTLNDNRGHHVGDLLLIAVADRLRHSLRHEDTVGRLGGDEFLVILEGLSNDRDQAAQQVQQIAEKILQSLNQVYVLDEQEYFNSPSIGICLFGDDDADIEDLLKRADQAMYHAKAAGRNTLRFFDPHMQASAAQRFALQNEIREALLFNQFKLYYQPQVDRTGRITGAEALIRWLHPERGMISPMDFIPIAEESGLILPLGNWILDAACQQLIHWKQNPLTAALTLSINVSARQFQQPDFVTQVLAAVTRTGANPHQLTLELTESILATNQQDIITKMDALKSHGIKFSLDDFGTGYSSLSYLKRLPINELKIDKSFVNDILTDPNDAAIARMVIRLAQSMELNVIAEGVETQRQRDWLEQEGCLHYQGYYFGKPVGAEEFLR
ncbi:bifunctional diguanylate cyclase/phosphodiesterase [Cellvibrio japonicus]|uniref:cyclic-guanylate-specific phosphodiesterase n=1 Tax=Cellvibrio japonicus (strain Ueda107) TaxID=498211 RepID=B3PHS3_CELJU|nr:EAL domain-containing protein [Cellvibrio japonicus]ACE85781.1 sensory box/GGDEF family protein [Cellvibrio japonicus Ueda107]QEI13868.1 EAL domain-containing protein [Cellvibrio japonicus]QEI17442.1 EAL domain-containing protein [Cellvibrio japonicus]QEI21018.1 EAL domain-containing protein [Cellvibrio japonicus]